MKTFTDTKGRGWEIDTNVYSLERVRDLVKLDFVDELDKALQRLPQSPRLMVDLLYVLCKPQADAAGVSDVDFGTAMSGIAIRQGIDAFMEELTDFFRFDPIRHRVLVAAMATMTRLQEKTAAYLEERVNDPAVERAVQKAMEASGKRFTDSLESLASTPDP